MHDEETITLQGEDGAEHRCRVLGVFEFEARDYALLLDLGVIDEDEDDNEPETVLMRLVEQNGEAVFRTIDDDAEFRRVSTYIRQLASEVEDEEEEEEEEDDGGGRLGVEWN
jgi:uncharacterized protein YrzB (UPF0473 family)